MHKLTRFIKIVILFNDCFQQLPHNQLLKKKFFNVLSGYYKF